MITRELGAKRWSGSRYLGFGGRDVKTGMCRLGVGVPIPLGLIVWGFGAG